MFIPCRVVPLKVILIMPGKNICKTYIAKGYYHVYNRGVEKRQIFLDTQDYSIFLKNLKTYLMPPPKQEDLKICFTLQGTTFKGVPRQSKNYQKEIELVAYCLMPNHFHFLVKQLNRNSLQKFMQSLTVKYCMYFNKKYKRVGQLFQSRFKAVLVNNDRYLLHLSRYIHLNPLEYTSNIESAYSSYFEFLRKRNTVWVKPDFILKFFESETILEVTKFNSYQKFVEKYKKDSGELLGSLTLEKEE